MLTKRLRKQIEWHFYNYPADAALYEEKRREIMESGCTASYDRVGGRGNAPSNPTESKFFKLQALEQERSWATVVRNTFIAFQFEPEYETMVELYINRKRYRELFTNGLLWERTFWRWRDNWLEYAYKWAQKLNLL